MKLSTVCLMALAKTSQGCEADWQSFTIGDRSLCLKIVGDFRRDEAASMCNELGASLPLPKNQQEQDDLYAAFKSFELLIAAVAIDGNDVVNEGTWVDSTGSNINYVNWDAPREPNGSTRENFVDMVLSWNGKWNDAGGEGKISVVCSKEVNINPCPSDAWEENGQGGCQPKPELFSLECNPHSMKIEIAKTVIPGVAGVSLFDQSCIGNYDSENEVWIINTALDECGTQITTTDDGNLSFSNVIKAKQFSSGAEIYTSSPVRIEFDCKYSSTYNDIEANEVNVIEEDADLDFETGIGSFAFSFKQYTDSTMNTIAEAGYQVALGATVFYKLAIDEPISGLDWVISDCAVEDINLNKNFQIVTNQCPFEPLQVQLTTQKEEEDRLQTSINLSHILFKFVEGENDDITRLKLRCTVTVCIASDEESTCKNGCQPANN